MFLIAGLREKVKEGKKTEAKLPSDSLIRKAWRTRRRLVLEKHGKKSCVPLEGHTWSQGCHIKTPLLSLKKFATGQEAGKGKKNEDRE